MWLIFTDTETSSVQVNEVRINSVKKQTKLTTVYSNTYVFAMRFSIVGLP